MAKGSKQLSSFVALCIVACVSGLMVRNHLFKAPNVAQTLKHTAQQIQSSITPPVDSIKPTHMLFDLNGVLFTINRQKALSHLGFFDVASYTLSGNKVEELEDLIFDILYRIGNDKPTEYTEDQLIPMHNEKALPTIMCSWMRGEIAGTDLIQQILPVLDQLDEERYFASKIEKKLVTKIISIMFDPEVRCDLYKPLKKGVNLLRYCKSLGHKTYLLSNMDSELIQLLKHEYPAIFGLFDGIIISADVHMIKPDENIYRHALKTFSIEPCDCFFIDDQEENIIGAKKLGIKGVHHNQRKVKKTYKELAHHGIVPHDHSFGDALQTA